MGLGRRRTGAHSKTITQRHGCRKFGEGRHGAAGPAGLYHRSARTPARRANGRLTSRRPHARDVHPSAIGSLAGQRRPMSKRLCTEASVVQLVPVMSTPSVRGTLRVRPNVNCPAQARSALRPKRRNVIRHSSLRPMPARGIDPQNQRHPRWLRVPTIDMHSPAISIPPPARPQRGPGEALQHPDRAGVHGVD